MPVCPCGSGLDYDECCGALHAGKPAPTAEALMRSRYTAYAMGNFDYLQKTCAPELRADYEPPGVATMPEWRGLKILRTVGGGAGDDAGQVEFMASYTINGQAHSLHELSDFRRVDGAWIYTAGEINPKQGTQVRDGSKVGRNDPCPCGSQKKYKKCCGAAKEA